MAMGMGMKMRIPKKADRQTDRMLGLNEAALVPSDDNVGIGGYI